ncbi:hypothetical protein HGM15179_020148 [Zosterops borbonicus]|uniref:Envelope protein n=1 Tax=Zosterops borbonicus TaxID=364589 RepID=A0A8K1D8K7_9PASS|nr:hypothetical protein HGM15179_020148 [Zosterops borbonicus]
MWSIFMQKMGHDPGVIMPIIQFLSQESNPVGPNRVLTNKVTKQKPIPTFTPTLSNPLLTRQAEQEVAPYALFYRMLHATFLSLNQSNPTLTEHCWLCYDTKPHFYEGIAINASLTYSNDPNPIECKWNASRTGITQAHITRQGTCVSNAALAEQSKSICSTVVMVGKGRRWAIPAKPGTWVCYRTGVTPCLPTSGFSNTNDFCVQVVIVPRVLYHSDQELSLHMEKLDRLQKRELITGVTIAVLLGLRATGHHASIQEATREQKDPREKQLQSWIKLWETL